MADDLTLLKKFIVEALSTNTDKQKVSASPTYMSKENVRKKLQLLLETDVANGTITSSAELAEWWKTLDMASNALRAVPFDAWKTISKKH